MKHATITTDIETISPAIAKEYLDKNTLNRKLRPNLVDHYANLIHADQWLLTHQGIAFDSDGRLLDGQHRLAAIHRADKPVTMMVTRGLPPEAKNHLGSIPTMDVIDSGSNRSVADQMHVAHGISNQNHVAGACATILTIIGGQNLIGRKLCVPQAMGVFQIYGRRIDSYIGILHQFKPAKLTSVIGAFAFAAEVHPGFVSEFATSFVSGVGLKAGDPVLALRTFFINKYYRNASFAVDGGTRRRLVIAEAVLHCILLSKNEERINTIRRTGMGREYFTKAQRTNVETIKAMFVDRSVSPQAKAEA